MWSEMNQLNQIQIEFMECCSLGDIERTERLLDEGRIIVDYHHPKNGWTALHWAAYRGHFWIVNLLVEAGFDPNALTLDQRTAIDLTSDDSVRDLLMHPHNNLRTHDRGKSGIPQLTVRKEHSGARTLHLNGGEVERDTGRRRSMEYGSPLSSASPTSKNIFHYGRRDSLNRTRYLLVKNRTEDSKDSYKRVTLPGSGIEDEENAVNNMKVTIEKAMKMGHVSEVLVLPGQVPVTSAEQIKMFGDNQKVEVVFTKPTVEISEKAKVSHQTVGPERGKLILKPPSEHMEGLYTKGVNHQNEASMENSHAEPEEIKLEENGHNDGEQSSPERLKVGDERSECVTTFDATKESKVKSVFESVHTEKEGYFKTNNEGAGDAVSSQHVNVNNILFSRGPENNSAEAILPEKVTHKEPALEFEVIPSSQLNVGESPDRHLETSTTPVAGTADTRKVELTDEQIPENSFTDTDEICLVSNEKISAAKDSESPVSEQMLFSSVNDISIESTIELTAANASEPATLDVRLKSMNTGEALTVDVQEKPRVPVVKSSPSNVTMPSHNDAEKASNKLATKTLPPYITHVVPAPEPEVLQEAKTASQFGMTHERLRNVMIVTGVIAGVSGVCGVAYYLYTRSK